MKSSPKHRAIFLAAFIAMNCVILKGYAADNAPPPAAPNADVKPDKNTLKASRTTLQTAIPALQKEVIAHADDPKMPLRTASNYFTAHPPKEPIAPEALIETLNTVFSGDSPSDSYIKWQLLSAAPAKFEGEIAHQAALVYQSAGKPIARPGLSYADKKELDGILKDVKTLDDSIVATKKLTDLIEPWQTRNAPVLAYRDALYARLPQNGEALVTRLEDIAQRVEAGYESRDSMAAVLKAIDAWIDTKPPSLHLQIVADRVTAWINRGKPAPAAKVIHGKREAVADPTVRHGKADGGPPPTFPPTYYEQVEYVPDLNFFVRLFRPGRGASDDKQWHWSVAVAQQVDGESLTDLLVTLEEYVKIAKEAETKAKK